MSNLMLAQTGSSLLGSSEALLNVREGFPRGFYLVGGGAARGVFFTLHFFLLCVWFFYFFFQMSQAIKKNAFIFLWLKQGNIRARIAKMDQNIELFCKFDIRVLKVVRLKKSLFSFLNLFWTYFKNILRIG